MDTLEKALLSLENVLKNIDNNELNQILSDIDNMECGDISYFDYLSYIESDYSALYKNIENTIFWDDELIEHESLDQGRRI